MLVNFGWVWPGRLAAMGRPRTGAAEDLMAEGIRAVLTLTEEPPLEELAAAGFVVCHEPIRDFTAPAPGTLARCVAFLKGVLDSGSPAVVHCFAGYGRTGTVLAAFLAANGTPPEVAIEVVRGLRPGSIETWEQRLAVIEYARGLRRPPGTAPPAEGT